MNSKGRRSSIMKKQLMQMAALAVTMGALLCSCEREKDIEAANTLDSGIISLVMGQMTTRADLGPAIEVNTYPIGTNKDGYTLTLEETITDMGPLEDVPETRGTPAYTQNVTDVYGNSFNGVLYGSTGQIVGDDPFTVMDGVTGKDGMKVWRRIIGLNPFKQSDPLYFFLRMPESPIGVSNMAYSYSAGSIEFDYTTPSTAATQQDILFAARQLDEATYLNEFKTNGGASILFRHALTGVKFAIGNNNTTAGARHPNGTVETFITEVAIKGLKNQGHAKFIPVGTENGTQVDDITEYTSKDSFTWTNLTGSTSVVFTQTFGEDDIQDFQQDANDQVGAPTSFYAAGEDRNLNKADASLTFWFIPQAMTADVKITVKFKIWDGQDLGDEETLDLNLGSVILAQTDKPGYTNKDWKAGQLRTFKLIPNMVDVDITDDVSGYTKSNVVIRNTGNVKAFIRAHIVANWFGSVGTDGMDGIAVGYTSQTSSTFVDAWRRNGSSDNYGGAFTSLPGSGWVEATDGFFYYTQPVDPGAATGTALFNTYSLPSENVPQIWYLGTTRTQFQNVRLVMEIPVQAIMAKDNYTYTQAWEEAGVTVTPKS